MPDDPAVPAIDFTSRRQLARLLTAVENDPRAAAAIVRRLWPRTGRAHRIGITGPPGVGKSTLVDHLVALARAEGRTVAVVAVDPTSPLSGGAILGDRVRMLRHTGDPGVYIRSMAARDHLGGLAAATRDVAHVLDAFGFDVLVLETVGVGQSELDVMRASDTVVVVTAPGLGDSIQMLKAGVLEIADLIVVNKADRPGVRETVIHLREMLHLAPHRAAWEVPVVETAAVDGTGLPDLWRAASRHWDHLRASGDLEARRARRAEQEVMDLADQEIAARMRAWLGEHVSLGGILDRARSGALDPHSAAAAIVERMLAHAPTGRPTAS